MSAKRLQRMLGTAALVLPSVLLSFDASAAVVDLKCDVTTLLLPDGAQIPMWGFGHTTDPGVSVPGPILTVPPGDTALTINLTNYLPVDVSIVIPGLPAPLTPVWTDGTSGPRANLQQRVRSFTVVAPAASNGVPGQATYQWNDLRPGTFLYHSGTHPAVQVQMGLYGALKQDFGAATAYAGVAYDREVVLLYSEIDPALHTAVQTHAYGTPAYPSPVDYQPRYFLINGQPFTSASPPAATVQLNERVLLRLLNAGLQTKVPSLSTGYASLVAEDGRPYPYATERYSVLLAAGATRDALLTPATAGRIALYDRALNLTDAGATGGGAMTGIDVIMPSQLPVAVDDSYQVDEEGVLTTGIAPLQPGVLANDTGAGPLTAVLVSPPSAGTLVLSPDGQFTYTPFPNFAGIDGFTYQVTNADGTSNLASAWITLNPSNDTPLASDDQYDAVQGATLSIAAPGLLDNDTDPDGDTLSVVVETQPTGGGLMSVGDGSIEYTPAAGTLADSFTYRASDGLLASDPATVSIVVTQAANDPPLAVDDTAETMRNTPVSINLLANDFDREGNLDPGSIVVIAGPSRGGTFTNPGDGTVLYTPRHNFKGTDTFRYRVSDTSGLQSNAATVRVNVLAPNSLLQPSIPAAQTNVLVPK